MRTYSHALVHAVVATSAAATLASRLAAQGGNPAPGPGLNTAPYTRLDRVDVRKYEVMFQGIEGGQATVGVRYSMDFFWRDGSVERERNTNECYKVRQLPNEDRWVIVRNDDYQQRICYR